MGIVGGKDEQNPEFVFKTLYLLLLYSEITDANGCQGFRSPAYFACDASSNFKIIENFENVQGQVKLNNLSADASRFHWTFGNGDDSYAESPLNFIRDEGEYKYPLISREWNAKWLL